MKLGLKKSVASLVQLTSANVAVKFLGVLMIALYTRYLSKEDLAILPVYEMLAALSGIIFGLGVQPTLIRLLPAKYAENEGAARGLIYSGGLVLISGATIFAVGVFFLSGWLSPILFKRTDFADVIKILSLGFFFLAVRNVSHQILWSKSRFDKISVIQIIAAVGRAVLVGGLLLLWGIKGMALGLILNELLCASISVYFIRDIILLPRVPLYPIADLVKRSVPFYFEGFLIYFRSQGDNWIVATVLGPETMAIYFVAKRLPTMMLMFIESLDKVVTSEIAKRKNQPDEMSSYIKKLFLVNAHITLPGTAIAMGLAPLFILLVAGKAYTDSILPCLILCSVLPLQALQIPLGRGIFVIHPPMVRVTMTIIESIVLLASLYFMVPLLAENGIAISRLAATGTALFTAMIVLRRTIGLGLPWRQTALSAIFSIAMATTILGLQAWQPNDLLIPVYAFAGGLLFLILVHLFNSENFYETINRVLPFKLVDPIQFIRDLILRRNPSA